jgi:hypothetical protein
MRYGGDRDTERINCLARVFISNRLKLQDIISQDIVNKYMFKTTLNFNTPIISNGIDGKRLNEEKIGIILIALWTLCRNRYQSRTKAETNTKTEQSCEEMLNGLFPKAFRGKTLVLTRPLCPGFSSRI